MKIVFVKHPNNQKQFCFAVPESLVPFVHCGSDVVCDTRKGMQPAVAQTGVIYGEGVSDLAKQSGASFPLRNIIGVAGNISMDRIKIPSYLQQSIPSGEKIARRINELKTLGYFNTRIEIVDGVLRDGYTAYLVCKMLDRKSLPYIRSANG